MFQLGQFHLQLAFMTFCPQGEDVKNQCAAINHPATEFAFEVALLCGRQFVIEQNDIGIMGAEVDEPGMFGFGGW